MALVTVQRSPSVTGSPQCSISDGEADDDENGKCEKSECFFAGKGTALMLALKDIPQYAGERRLSTDSTRSSNSTQSTNSDIQLHLQSMFYLLRHEETLKMAVKLESQRPNRTRYLAIASRCILRNSPSKKGNGSSGNRQQLNRNSKTLIKPDRQDNFLPNTSPVQCSLITDNKIQSNKEDENKDDEKTNNRKRTAITMSDKIEKLADLNDIEESCLLGIDCNEKTTIGLVVPILADTTIHLDGDGGFSVSVFGKTHIFKPVSVQAMWSALQTLHKVSQKARSNNFYPGGPSHEWLSYYENRIESDRSCLNEWNAMDALESRRPPSPDAIRNKPTEKEETECVIRAKLKEIMMSVDLDEVTSKYIRSRLEDHLNMDLGEFKSFIDEEMLTILGQMDAPTEIFEHVYLGSEWNASNLEELQRNGVRHILNVTREIDNFFPGLFDYFNVRVYDDEKTNLLKYWDNTFKYITRAKAEGSKVLVHCKMGVSRSASVVIAYAMKAYNWDFDFALEHVKKRRNCIKPNKNFLTQLETYRGMLDAMKNKEKLQRSKSETNLKSTKDARLLPGSEPTPLIQALNHSKKSDKEKQRKILRRSSSTSPKSIQSSIVIKQQSQSLENLTPDRCKVDEQQKNVRFPGSNGQNYSVTQNQILHIQKNSPTTSVKTIVSGLESIDRKTVDDRKSLSLQIGKLVSVEGNEEAIAKQPQAVSPVWTSSAKLIQQTSNIIPSQSETVIHRTKGAPVSAEDTNSALTRVVGRRKTQSWTAATGTLSTEPSSTSTSRQSSSSSVDSSSVAGSSYSGERRELPLRHSSWSSGDNRLPSRNSSWGSYDTTRYNLCNPAIVEEKAHPDCNPGTVKRTKQKIEECTVLKKLCSDGSKGRVSNLYRSVSTTTAPKTKRPNRCNSEEIIMSGNALSKSHELSVSAPDSYSISRSGTESSTAGRKKDDLGEEKISGNVQTLKKNFEAKASSSSSGKKGKSLPSSPVALHTEISSTDSSTANSQVDGKDRNVKGLVSKYQSSSGSRVNQNSSSASSTTPATPATTTLTSSTITFNTAYKTRPRSFYESRSYCSTKTTTDIGKVHYDFSRPPVPPVIKSHHPTTNRTMTDGILTQNLTCNYRRVQPHEKTHPLARLSISKQRFNTAAYNTM